MLYFLCSATGAPINIGIIGFASPAPGRSICDAAKMAALEINAKGGINGRPVKLFVYDDHGKSTDAVEPLQRVVYSDHVAAVVGVWISEAALGEHAKPGLQPQAWTAYG